MPPSGEQPITAFFSHASSSKKENLRPKRKRHGDDGVEANEPPKKKRLGQGKAVLRDVLHAGPDNQALSSGEHLKGRELEVGCLKVPSRNHKKTVVRGALSSTETSNLLNSADDVGFPPVKHRGTTEFSSLQHGTQQLPSSLCSAKKGSNSAREIHTPELPSAPPFTLNLALPSPPATNPTNERRALSPTFPSLSSFRSPVDSVQTSKMAKSSLPTPGTPVRRSWTPLDLNSVSVEGAGPIPLRFDGYSKVTAGHRGGIQDDDPFSLPTCSQQIVPSSQSQYIPPHTPQIVRSPSPARTTEPSDSPPEFKFSAIPISHHRYDTLPASELEALSEAHSHIVPSSQSQYLSLHITSPYRARFKAGTRRLTAAKRPVGRYVESSQSQIEKELNPPFRDSLATGRQSTPAYESESTKCGQQEVSASCIPSSIESSHRTPRHPPDVFDSSLSVATMAHKHSTPPRTVPERHLVSHNNIARPGDSSVRSTHHANKYLDSDTEPDSEDEDAPPLAKGGSPFVNESLRPTISYEGSHIPNSDDTIDELGYTGAGFSVPSGHTLDEMSESLMGSSLPAVVKEFCDMFEGESSYPEDFPMSLR